MPNWCRNKLTVTGPADDVNAFQTSVAYRGEEGDTELSLEKLHPTPPILLMETSPRKTPEGMAVPTQSVIDMLTKDQPLETDDWYSWRIRNWGTKWEITATIKKVDHFKNGNTKVVYEFDSAWSPPCKAFKYACENWPTLTFRLTYQELDMGVGGSETYKAGEENLGYEP